jgi:WD40-like Beta Propeller Repeat
VALSPDGRKIAFAGGPDRGSRLIYLRSLDSPPARPILGTEGVSVYFWSPDSASIGFYADRHQQLKSVSLASGAVTVIVKSLETTWITTSPGAYWSPDGTIVFAQSGGLYRVPAQGGEPALITSAGFAPAPLSGGRWMYREDLGDGSSVIQVVGPGLATPVTLPVSSNAVFAAFICCFEKRSHLSPGRSTIGPLVSRARRSR